MTSPTDVAQFHADYDVHPDDRVRLFSALAGITSPDMRVLYPGSYVDIAPSVWFDDVTYLDVDKRAARFFGNASGVAQLVQDKRQDIKRPNRPLSISFHHLDYQTPVPEAEESFDVLVSLYAGFISEHCTHHLKIGGLLLVNPSHGDAAMASIDPRYELAGVVTSNEGKYKVVDADLDSYLVPKKEQVISIDSIHTSGRGIGYTRSPFAYLFKRTQ